MKIIVSNFQNPRTDSQTQNMLSQKKTHINLWRISRVAFIWYTGGSHVLWKWWQFHSSVIAHHKSCAHNQSQDVPDTLCPRGSERTCVKSPPLRLAPRPHSSYAASSLQRMQIPPILAPSPWDRRCYCTLAALHAPKTPPVGNSKPPNIHRAHERRPGRSQNNSLFLSPAGEGRVSTQSLSPQSM